MSHLASCGFYARTQVSSNPDRYTYETVNINGPRGAGRLSLRVPPVAGDLIHLPGGPFRVLERAWSHAAYGSVAWPYGATEPKEGPMLDIIVVKDDGPFVGEAETSDDTP